MTTVAKHKVTPKGRVSSLPARRGMNGTETRYAQYLELRRINEEVAWWGYCVWRFRLADGAWYTPDFMVMLADGTLEIHETKGGFIREAAAVRLKVTSEAYWLFPVKLIREIKGGWQVRDVASEGIAA